MIVSRYSDSVIVDTLQDNHQMIHHNICQTEKYRIHLNRQESEQELCIYSLYCFVSFTEFDMNWHETMYKKLFA